MLSFGINHALWDTTIFVSSKVIKHVQKTAKSWEKVCLTTIFHQKARKKPFYKLENCLFFPHLFFRQSWTKVLEHFCISGAFSDSRFKSNPSPHATNNVGRVSPEIFFPTLYRVGGGRTGRNFRKGCTVLRGNREMTDKYEYCSTVPRTFLGPG